MSESYTKLAVVKLKDGHAVHDPATGIAPSIDTMRVEFTTQHYELTLAEPAGTVAVKPREGDGPTVVFPFASCRYALVVEQ